MKHEELLAQISKDSTVFRDELETESLWQRLANISNALRAVVELHKPQNKHEVEFGLAKCDGCYMPYPCPTIQAIEKELG